MEAYQLCNYVIYSYDHTSIMFYRVIIFDHMIADPSLLLVKAV